MIKQKLINKRREKGFSQEDIADKLALEQSQYSRRESGMIRISKKEWDTLTKILEVPLEAIYEPHDGVYVINKENSNVDLDNYKNYRAHSELALETMKKYIQKLEEENLELKNKLKKHEKQS